QAENVARDASAGAIHRDPPTIHRDSPTLHRLSTARAGGVRAEPKQLASTGSDSAADRRLGEGWRAQAWRPALALKIEGVQGLAGARAVESRARVGRVANRAAPCRWRVVSARSRA